MLVENNFIYISLPRCASTSFHISCVRNGLDIKFTRPEDNEQIYNLSLSNEEMLKNINHPHERILELEDVFGKSYEIISIKRDRYDRFISLWRFFIQESKRYGNYVYQIIRSLKIEDILFFNVVDLDKENVYNTTQVFLEKYNLLNKVDTYFINLLFILWQPTSLWHNNDDRIKWFDFNNLQELEHWVSDKLKKSFKMEFCNSSNKDKIDLIIDDNFIEKYNKIYDRFDLLKNKKTII